jgi:SAM-dependent methyltransferase
VERVLDFGCGSGDSWRKLGLSAEEWSVVGLDISLPRLCEAATQYKSRGWHYLRATGVEVPLRDSSVDGVLCNVALPYMNIPRALAELRRVLVPGGWLWASIHLPWFSLAEWRRTFPRPQQTMYRTYVLLNGIVFHCTGTPLVLGRMCESFQTERGMRLALTRAGFVDLRFESDEKRFWCKAKKPELENRFAVQG